MILECLSWNTVWRIVIDDDNIETGTDCTVHCLHPCNTVFICLSVQLVSTVNSMSQCIQYHSWTLCPTVTEWNREENGVFREFKCSDYVKKDRKNIENQHLKSKKLFSNQSVIIKRKIIITNKKRIDRWSKNNWRCVLEHLCT